VSLNSEAKVRATLASENVRGVVAAAAAALLFGVSAPTAKVLLSNADPLVLGAILYLGAGLGLTVVRSMRGSDRREASLRASDVPLILGVTIAGAVVAPVLLLVGLQRVTAITASLALNLEGPLTIALAVLFFGEHLAGSAAAGGALVLGGAAVLTSSPGAVVRGDVWGVLAVAGACLAWAVDNNLTQRLSLRDPLAIVQAKGLLGGCIGIVLAAAFRDDVPAVSTMAWGLVLGFVSYGLSVVLAVYAMRFIGVAREAILFATAPFIGVLVSIAMLGERFGVRELAAMLLMLGGLGMLSRERHSHAHAHPVMTHDHRHVHDVHHQHAHVSGDPDGEPHAHEHTHEALEHDHAHAPDLHHRHH
jgi:drug/metabolite transporter (DMT)-like permease